MRRWLAVLWGGTMLLTACGKRPEEPATLEPAASLPVESATPTAPAEPAAGEASASAASEAPALPAGEAAKAAEAGSPAEAAKAGEAAPAAGPAASDTLSTTTLTETDLGVKFYPKAEQGISNIAKMPNGETRMVQLTTPDSLAKVHAWYAQQLGPDLLTSQIQGSGDQQMGTIIKIDGNVQYSLSMTRVKGQTLITIAKVLKSQ